MPVAEPLSPRNPRVKRLGLLARKGSARAEQGVYLIEGVTLVAEALVADVALEAVFAEASAAGSDVVAAARRAGVEVHLVADGGLRGMVDVVSPQPVVAIAPRPAQDLAGVCAATDFLVVLVELGDPGNVGTVLRTAEASGAGGVITTTGGADPFSPKAVRASGGASFRLPIAVGVEPAVALAAVGAAGLARLGTAVADGTPYDAVDLRGPVALILGNEARGLAATLGSGAADLVDEQVTIPMGGRAESLNVAMAAAVLCFEVRRQRRSEKATG